VGFEQKVVEEAVTECYRPLEKVALVRDFLMRFSTSGFYFYTTEHPESLPDSQALTHSVRFSNSNAKILMMHQHFRFYTSMKLFDIGDDLDIG
jgi:hypothetical protein